MTHRETRDVHWIDNPNIPRNPYLAPGTELGDKYRRALADRPRRNPDQDLSWTVGEYEAAKPSIRRAETAAENAAQVNAAADAYIEKSGGFDAVVRDAEGNK